MTTSKKRQPQREDNFKKIMNSKGKQVQSKTTSITRKGIPIEKTNNDLVSTAICALLEFTPEVSETVNSTTNTTTTFIL